MSSPETDSYDRDFALHELLRAVPMAKLGNALRALLGPAARLLDAQANVIIGATQAPARRVPLAVELEPVGYLEADADDATLRPAAFLLEQLLRNAARYHMASILHHSTVLSDYAALQEKHAALQASEERYKTLAENLEQRVREQVQTIETSQQQLYQAEKMAAVGQLAAGVAHEINTPIGFVKSNLNTARGYLNTLVEFGAQLQDSSADSTTREAWRAADLDFALEDFASLLQESSDGIARVARIVADLRVFSSVDGTEIGAVDVNALLRTVCSVAAAQVAPRATVKLELGELSPLRGRPGHLNQVFLNLLLNAALAVEAGKGVVRLKTWTAAGESGAARRSDPGAIDAEVCVEVADNGCGIPPHVLSRIFDPFFTKRDVGQGTGLGLTVSRDIVRAHGGRIEVESTPGAGTTFRVYLPVDGENNGAGGTP